MDTLQLNPIRFKITHAPSKKRYRMEKYVHIYIYKPSFFPPTLMKLYTVGNEAPSKVVGDGGPGALYKREAIEEAQFMLHLCRYNIR